MFTKNFKIQLFLKKLKIFMTKILTKNYKTKKNFLRLKKRFKNYSQNKSKRNKCYSVFSNPCSYV